MTIARDTTGPAREIQLAILRRLGGPTRLEMACRMSDEAREITVAGIRHRHPDWTDAQVQVAVRALLLGPDLANEVISGRPAPT